MMLDKELDISRSETHDKTYDTAHDTAHLPTAPEIDRLLGYFDRGHMNPTKLTAPLDAALRPLIRALSPIAPVRQDDRTKSIWLRLPRGDISCFDPFEDLKEIGEVETYEEYEALWKEEYPDDAAWYRISVTEDTNRDGSLRFRGLSLGGRTVISGLVDMDDGLPGYMEEAAIQICSSILPAVKETVQLVRDGRYDAMVEDGLPYRFRTGVIKRSDMWEADPERMDWDRDGISQGMIDTFQGLLGSHGNGHRDIGRIKDFTASHFFRACAIGYKACGLDVEGMEPSALYLRYADGRDEGLTGTGSGLNEGPGIDYDDPKAWHDWYYGRRSGGHPWEVLRGGNSTHVDLMPCGDEHELRALYRIGMMSKAELERQCGQAGYYLTLQGKYRTFEIVAFYIALSEAGFPVALSDAEEILDRLTGNGYVGIVPHALPTRYCEGLFPASYGKIIDFIHVQEEEMDVLGRYITWLPQEPVRLL